MLISEMHRDFKVALDKVDSLNYPDILPEEIDVFLNTNIEKFISQRAYGNNARREGVEETQKRFDDLLTLITSANTSSFGTSPLIKPNAVIAALPTDYWHALEEEANISYTDCNNVIVTERVPVYPVTHDKYNKVIRDPFNKPDTSKVLRMGLGGSVELIHDPNSTITGYFLRYIRKPASVQYGTTYAIPTTDIDCDLPISTHKEIIAMAVADCLEKIESRRTPIANQLLNTLE